MILIAWRVVCFGLVVVAFVWARTVLATLPPPGLLGMAQGVQSGQIYPPDRIRAVLAQISDADCRVAIRRSALLLHLRLFDAENRLDPAVTSAEPAGGRLVATRNAAHALLACAPSEGLGWLALYLTSIRQSGFGPEALAELSAAYRYAPHEAWLQALRLPAVLAAYPVLPQELQRAAMTDFDDLLTADMQRAVATLIATSSPSMREMLLSRLCSFPSDQRAVVAAELEPLRRGLTNRCLPISDRPGHLR